MFKVRATLCATCIYKGGLGWDLTGLEAEVRDKFVGFAGWRICHHTKDVCCRGFWNAHKDKFQLGQIAQRLNMVVFVDEESGRDGDDTEPA
jgi:hypothetical protein